MTAQPTATPNNQLSLLGDRGNNQDRALLLHSERRSLMVLGDGMGGHADGALAAQCLIDAAEAVLADGDDLNAMPLMQKVIVQAHLAIKELRPDLTDSQQPRTTAVLCVIQGRSAIFGHAGDSRGYLIRQGQLVCRTRDHSVVEMLMREGKLDETEMRDHPLRNQVSRCLGGSGHPPILEFTPCPALQIGDCLLLCSDGFWEPLGDAELVQDIQDASLQELGERAVARHPGRADNCTALRLVVKSV